MNKFDSFLNSVSGSAQGIGGGVVDVLAAVIVAVVVFVVGWVIGVLVARVIEQIVKTIQLDKLLSAAGIDDLMHKMGVKLNSGRFLGELVKWYVIVVALIFSFEILGLTQVTSFLSGVAIGYLPQVISAVLILVIAAVIAEAVRKAVVASAKGAGVASANFVGSVAKWAIWIFALLAALFQLGIAATFIQTIFTGVIVALALALGLSFGLGGQDAARDYIGKLRNEIKRD
ncbi:MAG: hypothetical protein RL150_68 [Candidatus Parcubacteria bacterium]|jgi:uncharacterized protein YneF (UPF0154 family)